MTRSFSLTRRLRFAAAAIAAALGVFALVAAFVLGSNPQLGRKIVATAHSNGGGTVTNGSSSSAPTVSQQSNPFATVDLYADPDSPAAVAAADTSLTQAQRSVAATIASYPSAIWLTPEQWGVDQIGSAVSGIVSAAQKSGTVPLFVIYGIPNRDCGGYSSGGLSEQSYASWIDAIAQNAGGGSSIAILEPDAAAYIASGSCLGDEGTHAAALADAVSTLTGAGVALYLDAGHSGWAQAGAMATVLRQAGIAKARGFSLNVSNYDSTPEEVSYGTQISEAIGSGSHFVIDTSRNGNGGTAGGQWCNPSGQALGTPPAAVGSEYPLVDAYVWAKIPGTSDGECNGGPAAGVWWPSGAAELLSNSSLR